MDVKEHVKKLWKLCFDDSDEFVELYFRLRYNNDVNVAIFCGDEAISALQMIPYPMTFLEKEIQTSYISGACTHPDYRGKGVMRELLLQSFTRMEKEGILLSTLIPAEPWLFGYYERMGYAPVFDYSVRRKDIADIIATPDIQILCSTHYDKVIYDYFAGKMSSRPCCVQHTAIDFEAILADLALSGGCVLSAHTNREITGMAMVLFEENKLLVKELFTDNTEIENGLLHKASEIFKCNTVYIMQPPADTEHTHRLGMARIIQAKNILQLYAIAYPEENISFELTDEQLPSNNGYYHICGGECNFSKRKLPGTHVHINISELTGKIFAKQKPYMSLMLD